MAGEDCRYGSGAIDPARTVGPYNHPLRRLPPPKGRTLLQYSLRHTPGTAVLAAPTGRTGRLGTLAGSHRNIFDDSLDIVDYDKIQPRLISIGEDWLGR